LGTRQYLDIGDQKDNRPSQQETSAIYQTSDNEIVHKISLIDSMDVAGYWLYQNTIIAPNSSAYSNGGEVLFYKYPAGGEPTGALKKGFYSPLHAAISP
jgi:hypothetical protein